MATRTKKLRVLNEIYAALPSIDCKGLCWNTCGYILVMPIEVQNIEARTGQPVDTVQLDPLGTGDLVCDGMPAFRPTPEGACPHLKERRCSIHAHRPFICRIYGVGEGILCPHGCRPTRVAPRAEVEMVMKQIRKLG